MTRETRIEILVESLKRLEARLRHALIEECAAHDARIRVSWSKDIELISQRISQLKAELEALQTASLD